jgi:hypothetical protein
VSRAYRQNFLREVGELISWLPVEDFEVARRFIGTSEKIRYWVEETPATIVKHFKSAARIRFPEIIRLMLEPRMPKTAKDYPLNPLNTPERRECYATIFKEPKPKRETFVGPHHERLAEVIRTHKHCPPEYRELDPIQLTWRFKDR